MFANNLCAQWTPKDSLWLIDVLSNKKEIRLKPEILEAIQSGNLIRLDRQNNHEELIVSPMHLPLSKDFNQYIQNGDTVSGKFDYTTMPPAVFMLSFKAPPISNYSELKSFSLEGMENYVPDRPQPIINTDPLTRGQASGGVYFMFNINDVVNYYILKKRY